MRTQSHERLARWLVIVVALSHVPTAHADQTIVYEFTAEFGEDISGAIEAPDGSIYAATLAGGESNLGVVLRADACGDLTVLHSFTPEEGAAPSGGVVLGPDGALYGTTSRGGPNGYGIAFRLGLGGRFTTLHAFSLADGGAARAPLLLADDGNLYGVTAGDSHVVSDENLHPHWVLLSGGAVFRLEPATRELHVIHQLAHGEGIQPVAGLIQASDGDLYGSTSVVRDLVTNAVVSWGTLFRVGLDGTFTRLFVFDIADGSQAVGRLAEGPDGTLFGAGYGDLDEYRPAGGTLFRYSRAGALDTLFTFPHQQTYPSSLTLGDDGALYGTTYFGGSTPPGTLFRWTPGGNVETLYTFDSWADGRPNGALVRSRDSGFIGSTNGFIFHFSNDGTTRTLARVTGFRNGRWPSTGLTAAADGSFYGVSADYNGVQWFYRYKPGRGVTTFPEIAVFGSVEAVDGHVYIMVSGDALAWSLLRVVSGGRFETVFSFDAASGGAPGDLTQARDGSFYGVSGARVIRVDPTGVLTTLYTIDPTVRPGPSPRGGLVKGGDGNLYGVSAGVDSDPYSIYRVTPDGVLTTLHSFDGGGPDSQSLLPLTLGSDGNVYGVHVAGNSAGSGSIYRVTPDGAFSVFYEFGVDPSAGAYPSSQLLLGRDGNLYGTTAADGGTVFRLTNAGALTTLHRFASEHSGWLDVHGKLAQGRDGALYGAATPYDEPVQGILFRIPLEP